MVGGVSIAVARPAPVCSRPLVRRRANVQDIDDLLDGDETVVEGVVAAQGAVADSVVEWVLDEATVRAFIVAKRGVAELLRCIPANFRDVNVPEPVVTVQLGVGVGVGVGAGAAAGGGGGGHPVAAAPNPIPAMPPLAVPGAPAVGGPKAPVPPAAGGAVEGSKSLLALLTDEEMVRQQLRFAFKPREGTPCVVLLRSAMETVEARGTPYSDGDDAAEDGTQGMCEKGEGHGCCWRCTGGWKDGQEGGGVLAIDFVAHHPPRRLDR